MFQIGDKFPEFEAVAVVSGDYASAFRRVTHESYAGKWKLYFFWPKDFTFVCPTEIAGFGRLHLEFLKRDCEILGGSTDSEYVHLAWRNDHTMLQALPFPMLSDIRRDLCGQLGILDAESGVAQRATFLVDPAGVIQFVYVTAASVGRNPEEVLRVLDALQTEQLCPCGWQSGEATLAV